MKITVIGSGPLPRENRGIANAAGLRTEQFVQELQKHHDVSLIVIENKKSSRIETLSQEKKEGKYWCHQVVSKSLPSLEKELQKNIKDFSPDVVFGINTFPAYIASKAIPRGTPFWADLNGWVMTEMQAQAWSMGSNAFLRRGWEMEKEIISKADKISTVSYKQKYACYGELSAIGRLSKDNFRHEFLEVVENACLPLRTWEEKKSEKKFRGKIFPENAKVLLWIGGFNAWADEKTLFSALERVMEKDKNIHFICTGGILSGIDEKKFPWFEKHAQNSRYTARFHFMGWLPSEDIPFLLHECNTGITFDIQCPETEFGARNRINEFLRYGLAVVTTQGTEISNIVGETNAGWACRSGNIEEIEKAFLESLYDEEEKRKKKINAEILKNTRFSASITQSVVKKWLENIQPAPDGRKCVDFRSRMSFIAAAWHYYKTRGVKAFLQKIFQTLQT